jgi:predicted nucleic acid-binding Zn ribbon protein
MTRETTRQISESIGKVIRELGLGKQIRQYEVLELWSGIVGEQIASVTEAERIVGGKLFVRVSRPTWRNELVYLRKELIAKINAAMNEEIVREIIFR